MLLLSGLLTGKTGLPFSIHIPEEKTESLEVHTDEDDDVAGWSPKDLASPGGADRFQAGLIPRHEDGGRRDVAHELEGRHGFQERAVPVTVAVGLLEILRRKNVKRRRR